jgi:hypothetical protein
VVKEYNIQDYWLFGLCPSSGILKATKEHDVSKTGAVSVLGRLRPLRTETDQVFETLCSFLLFTIPDNGQTKTPSNPECL